MLSKGREKLFEKNEIGFWAEKCELGQTLYENDRTREILWDVKDIFFKNLKSVPTKFSE